VPSTGYTALLMLLIIPLHVLGRTKKYLVEIADSKESSYEKDYQLDAGVGVEAAVKMMNDLRAKHGAGPMVLDNSQQQKAKQSAEMVCQTGFNHHGKAATSLYMEGGYRPNGDALTRAVMSWYSEEPQYAQYYDNPSSHGLDAAGHFTDVIWKANTKVGIAKHSCNGITNVALVTGDDSGQRVSNTVGQIGQNVGRPSGQSVVTTIIRDNPQKGLFSRNG